jgi:hypothetical protein
MPSSIAWSFAGRKRGSYETAFPEDVVRFRVFEPGATAPQMLLILCDSQDWKTWVYQFEESDEVGFDTPIDELATHMTAENRKGEPLLHGEERYIDTYGPAGIDMRIYIGHQSLFAFRDEVRIFDQE